jgi:hypothetical protein
MSYQNYAPATPYMDPPIYQRDSHLRAIPTELTSQSWWRAEYPVDFCVWTEIQCFGADLVEKIEGALVRNLEVYGMSDTKSHDDGMDKTEA